MYEVAKENVHKVVDTQAKMADYVAKGFTAVGVVDPSSAERAAAAAQVITDEAYVTLLDDFHAAAAVIALIAALPSNASTQGKITQINAADTAYTALTAQGKTFVINYDVLTTLLALIPPPEGGGGS